MSIRENGAFGGWRERKPEQTRRSNDRKLEQVRNRKRRARSPELAEDGVEALDDFMRSNRFNAIQSND